MNFLKAHYKIIIAILHGILLFIVLWNLSNSAFTSVIDEGILKQVSPVRNSLFGSSPRYDHDFVFINISRDPKLVSDPSEYGEIALTDRSKLAQFFKILADNGNRHHYALCDIFLEYATDDDTALSVQVKRCKKLLFPYHITADTIEKPCVEVNSALSDFVTYTGNFSKFRLTYRDSLKTIPLVMLEDIDKKKYPASFLDFKSIFPRYYIRPEHLFETKKYPYYNLGELLMLSEVDSFYHNFLEGKFIVICNFESDVHNSPVGKIPGPLILVNTYLTIRNRTHVSWWWAFFMTAGLSYVSYLLFFGKVKPPDIRKHPWMDFFLQVFVNKYFSFFGICLLLAVISELIFSVPASFSLLLLYLLAVNFFREFYKKHYKKEK